MVYYQDLREYIKVLEEREKLLRIKNEVVKETELAPFYWLQFRGLPEEQWKCFLFENVVGVKGGKYGSVLMGPYASSRDILALGMNCQPDEINEKWCNACRNPIQPEVVESGPVQDVVIESAELDRFGVIDLPAPVEVPGFASTIRTTTQFITKDPETGIRNVGTYSGHIFSKRDMVWGLTPYHHGGIHLLKSREKGKPLPVAIVIGALPSIVVAASAPVAYEVDELAVAGGIAGEPVKLVKCKTVDLEVPATAEIVIEGEVDINYMAPHPNFGDYPGYIYETKGALYPVIKVTGITHHKDPLFATTVVGYPSNDALILSSVAREMGLYRHLKYECYLPGVLDVAFPLSGGGSNYCVVQIRKRSPWEPWQVLNALAGYDPGLGKMAIVVDEDIDPRDSDAVNWALAYSMQPHRDARIITQRTPRLDPSGYPPESSHEERSFPSPSGASAILIDATRKWAY
jgi:4-hydroxy-3-polyprenylbenzoate decarboxylase